MALPTLCCVFFHDQQHRRRHVRPCRRPRPQQRHKNPAPALASFIARCCRSSRWIVSCFPFVSRNNMTKSQLPAKYCSSPESRASASPSYESPSSPIDSMNSSVFAKKTEGIPYNHELRFRTALQPGPFSPGWDRLTDTCNFSPLANHSPLCRSASAALKHWEPKTLHAKLSPGRGRLSAGSHVYRSSPVTPLPQLGEGKFVLGPCSDSGTHPNHEDDTPDILKDTCSPIVTVKATSPNQKRISPPYKHLNDMRPSSSSPATGRKFILQSVPSFPPLTPYSNNTRRNDT